MARASNGMLIKAIGRNKIYHAKFPGTAPFPNIWAWRLEVQTAMFRLLARLLFPNGTSALATLFPYVLKMMRTSVWLLFRRDSVVGRDGRLWSRCDASKFLALFPIRVTG